MTSTLFTVTTIEVILPQTKITVVVIVASLLGAGVHDQLV
jgi:hypothetical protein